MYEQEIMDMVCGRQDVLGCLAMPLCEGRRARALHGMTRNAQAVLCFSNELSCVVMYSPEVIKYAGSRARSAGLAR